MFAEPVEGCFFIHEVIEGVADDVIADEMVNAEEPGVDDITADRVHVEVSPMPAEYGERRSAEDIERPAAAVAVVAQRTLSNERFPALPGLKELRKERQLTMHTDGSTGIPLGVIPPARSIDGPRCSARRETRRWESGLTRRVNDLRRDHRLHSLIKSGLAASFELFHFSV